MSMFGVAYVASLRDPTQVHNPSLRIDSACVQCFSRCPTCGVRARSLFIETICACVQGFDCKELLYTDYKQLPAALEKSLNCRYVKDVADLVKECDIVTINAPLHKVGLL